MADTQSWIANTQQACLWRGQSDIVKPFGSSNRERDRHTCRCLRVSPTVVQLIPAQHAEMEMHSAATVDIIIRLHSED